MDANEIKIIRKRRLGTTSISGFNSTNYNGYVVICTKV